MTAFVPAFVVALLFWISLWKGIGWVMDYLSGKVKRNRK